MKKAIKRIGIICIIAIVAAALYIYMKNEGIYLLSNINNTELDWINKYAIYKEPFPEDTIVEDFTLENDAWGIPYISHDQYIEAILLVPNEEIERVVPEFAREYDLEHSLDLTHGETDEQIQYNVFMPRTVTKWIDKTQRSVCYTVMEPKDGYTRVYVFVDKLGWNLYSRY